MDPSLGIGIRRLYSLGKSTQQLQSARTNSAVLYKLHYVQKQFCLCVLTLANIQTFCRNIFTIKMSLCKAQENSTPSFGEVWIEFRGPFLSFFSLRGQEDSIPSQTWNSPVYSNLVQTDISTSKAHAEYCRTESTKWLKIQDLDLRLL